MLQAGQLSRDQMLANIHYFRVRDYAEQVILLSTCCFPNHVGHLVVSKNGTFRVLATIIVL